MNHCLSRLVKTIPRRRFLEANQISMPDCLVRKSISNLQKEEKILLLDKGREALVFIDELLNEQQWNIIDILRSVTFCMLDRKQAAILLQRCGIDVSSNMVTLDEILEDKINMDFDHYIGNFAFFREGA